MTARIESLKALQWNRAHHQARRTLPDDMALPYRDSTLTDVMRCALRTRLALDLETPYLMPGELIAFTRTVPNLPFLYSEEEWQAIRASHFIHESGNVSNLSRPITAE